MNAIKALIPCLLLPGLLCSCLSQAEKDAAAKKLAYAALVEKGKALDFNDPWNIAGFEAFTEDYALFSRIWLDTAANEAIRSLRYAKWRYARGGFDHQNALVYQKHFGLSALPNINLDTLLHKSDIPWCIEYTRKEYDNAEFYHYGTLSEDMPEEEDEEILRTYFDHEGAENAGEITGHYWRLPVYQRNSVVFKFLWSSFKPLLFKHFSDTEYKGLHADFYVKNLLYTYSLLKAHPKGFHQFEKALQAGEALEPEHYEQYKTAAFREKFTGRHASAAADDPEDRVNRWQSWFFSFWFRRHIEGTADISYEILQEINKYYTELEVTRREEQKLTFVSNEESIWPYYPGLALHGSFDSTLQSQPVQALPYSCAPYFFENLYKHEKTKQLIHKHLHQKGRDTTSITRNTNDFSIYSFRSTDKKTEFDCNSGFLWELADKGPGRFDRRTFILYKRLPLLDSNIEVFLGIQKEVKEEDEGGSSDGRAFELLTYDRRNAVLISRKRIISTGVSYSEIWYYGGFTIDKDYTIRIKYYVGRDQELQTMERELKVLPDGSIREDKAPFCTYQDNISLPDFAFSI